MVQNFEIGQPNDQNEKKEEIKKSLKEVLSLFLKGKKKKESSEKEEVFAKEINDNMNEARCSYKSIMNIHKILIDAYKNISNDQVNNK